MKYPKSFAVAAGLLVIGAVAYLNTGWVPSAPEALRDAPADELNGEVKATVEVLKGKASEKQGDVSGRLVSSVPSNTMRFRAVEKNVGKTGPSPEDRKYVCQDEMGEAGYNQITVGQLLATRQGECSKLINALRADGIKVKKVKQESLRRADLKGANLRGAYLPGLMMDYIQLQGADLASANLFGASMERANLEGANLENINAYSANFGGAFLDRANMRLSCLEGRVSFRYASLRYTDLTGSSLEEAILSDTDLYNIFAHGVKAEKAAFMHAKMDKADFSHADLSYGDLRGADMRGANLSGTKLDGAQYDDRFDGHTEFPALFNPLRKGKMRNYDD